MRWRALFADLEAQMESADQLELAGEVADRSRREVAAVQLLDRLRANVGTELTLALAGCGVLRGRLAAAGEGWLLLDAAALGEVLVATAAVEWVAGLPVAALPATAVPAVERRLTLAYALRGVARDRASVILCLRDGTRLNGTLDRVGADFVDLAEHATDLGRRPHAVRTTRAVPFAALAAVQSA